MLTRSGSPEDERLAVVLCFFLYPFYKWNFEFHIEQGAFEDALMVLLRTLDRQVPGICPDTLNLRQILGERRKSLFNKKCGPKDRDQEMVLHPNAMTLIPKMLDELGVTHEARVHFSLVSLLKQAKGLYNRDVTRGSCC